MRQLLQNLRSGELQVMESPDPASCGDEVLVQTTWSLISAGTERAITSAAARSLVGKAQKKGHAAFLKASFDPLRGGGHAPIPYDRLIEATLATLLAPEALSRGDRSSIVLEGQP